MTAANMKEAYHAYLLSPEWKRKRLFVLQHYGRHCSLCGTKERLTVHHLRYADTWGDENMEDFCVLCWPCHERLHAFPKSLAEFNEWKLARNKKRAKKKANKRKNKKWSWWKKHRAANMEAREKGRKTPYPPARG